MRGAALQEKAPASNQGAYYKCKNRWRACALRGIPFRDSVMLDVTRKASVSLERDRQLSGQADEGLRRRETC